jgi:hypothetical protein
MDIGRHASEESPIIEAVRLRESERGIMSKSTVRWLSVFILGLGPLALALDVPGIWQGQLKGKLMDFAGKPIASARIEIRYMGPATGPGASATQAPGKPSASPLVTKTNRKGWWSFRGLESGVWEVTALADCYQPVSRKCSVSQVWDNSLVLLEVEKKPKLR